MKDGAAGRSSANVQRLLEIVDAFVAEMSPRGHKPLVVGLESHFERDLGLDSLARTELLSRIEKALGVRFPLDLFGQAVTPRDLLRFLEGKHPGGPHPRSVPSSLARRTVHWTRPLMQERWSTHCSGMHRDARNALTSHFSTMAPRHIR